jgi:hypothetical protein
LEQDINAMKSTRTKLIINQELSLRTKIRSLDTQNKSILFGEDLGKGCGMLGHPTCWQFWDRFAMMLIII